MHERWYGDPRDLIKWTALIDLAKLNRPPIATFSETCQMVEGRRLWGRGIQWNDANILASSVLASVPLWTLDRRLKAISEEMGVGFTGA